MIGRIARDCWFALQTWRRMPGMTAVMILTLAFGIGLNTAIFSAVKTLLLDPLPYGDVESLDTIWNRFANRDAPKNRMSPPEFRELRERSTTYESFAVHAEGDANLSGDAEPLAITIGLGTANLFEVLGVEPWLGRAFTEAEENDPNARVAILNHALWMSRFAGDPEILGTPVLLDGAPFTVVGIMPAGFEYPLGSSIDLWVPLYLEVRDNRGQHGFMMVGRRAPGVTPERADDELQALGARVREEHPGFAEVEFDIYRIAVRDEMLGDVRPVLVLLMAAAGLVLAISIVNIANLLLARSVTRRRELTVRAALGASRGRLIAQLLTESVVLALLGGALGILVATWGVDLLTALSPAPELHPNGIDVDTGGLAFALSVSIATGLAFGVAPAWHSSRLELADVLKATETRAGGSLGGRRLQRVLLVAEIALAVVLLVGAGLMLRSFVRASSIDPGFPTENLLTVWFKLPNNSYGQPEQRVQFYDELVRRTEELTEVQGAGLYDHAFFTGQGSGGSYEVFDTVAGTVGDEASRRLVGPSTLDTMGLRLVEGRWIGATDTAATPPVVVIDRALKERHWPDESPLDRTMKFWGEPFLIVGVVEHVRDDSLEHSVWPQLYFPYAQHTPHSSGLLVRTTGDPKAIVPALRGILASMDPRLAISESKTVDEWMAAALARRRFLMTLFALFAGLAAALAAVGLYGLMAYNVSSRTQELGVRLALGADPVHLRRLVIASGLRLALVGIVIGTIVAVALGFVLSDTLVYGVSALDPATFVSTVAALIAVAGIASAIPARRAAALDPSVALRHD